ncbi:MULTISPECIES: hypothetical protein [Dickeya]|uniref:hypothetical protein n=1 Tax=Dickeya TaxID=204037 RepID=UPI0003188D39|nr:MULTISPECIES: hypothetical protein [Dickeya]
MLESKSFIFDVHSYLAHRLMGFLFSDNNGKYYCLRVLIFHVYSHHTSGIRRVCLQLELSGINVAIVTEKIAFIFIVKVDLISSV